MRRILSISPARRHRPDGVRLRQRRRGRRQRRYMVRAAFDNGSFLVPGEVVRVAGADVGVIESTDVSREDEVIALDPEPHAEPGKAIIVMNITDPGFQDFRRTPRCIIRPQSLLGERFVDCRPTQPRAPGSEPPPPLEQIAEARRGRRVPAAARGERQGGRPRPGQQHPAPALPRALHDHPQRTRRRARRARRRAGEVIERANPALRETDRILAILASQDKTLAQLTRDSNEVLAPLARQRAARRRLHRQRRATPPRPPPSAAPTSSASSSSCPPTCASCAG